jgi:hypothetical protein
MLEREARGPRIQITFLVVEIELWMDEEFLFFLFAYWDGLDYCCFRVLFGIFPCRPMSIVRPAWSLSSLIFSHSVSPI